MSLLSRGNGGNMNIDLPCQSCDRASIASAKGSGIGDTNWERCVLWTVASMYVQSWSFPRPEDLGHFFKGAAFTLLLWAGSAEIGGPLDLSRLDSPECVWPRWLYLEFVAIGTDTLLNITRYGKRSHPVC